MIDIPVIASIFLFTPFSMTLVKYVMEESPELNKFMESDDEDFDVCIIEIFLVESFLVRLKNFKSWLL